MCVYCGSHEGLTRDHVPPRCLFGSKVPQGVDLVTVPCCERCRRGQGRYDEKLKLILATMYRSYGNPVAEEICRGSLKRALRRPEAGALARAVDGAKPIELVTPAGLFLGDALQVEIMDAGVHQVMERIVRGLYWKEFEERVPDGQEVQVYEMLPQPEDVRPECLTVRVVDPVVFIYAFARTDDTPPCSLWLLEFYQGKCFSAIIKPGGPPSS